MTAAFQVQVLGWLLAGCAALLAALACVAAVISALRVNRESRRAADVPAIRDALIDYISGSDDPSRLRAFAQSNPATLTEVLLAFEGKLAGSALDRLCDLTIQLALIDQWIAQAHARNPNTRRAAMARLAFVSDHEPCRRLSGDVLLEALADPDPETRLAAARGLLRGGDLGLVTMIFQAALDDAPLGRILLAEELRRHAVMLCQDAVPEVLRSNDSRRVAAALEFLLAWERAIPVADLLPLLERSERPVRALAIRIASLVPLGYHGREFVISALEDPDPELRLAAVNTVGRLRMNEALPALARSLRLGSARVARAAAAALAAMPPAGPKTLEELAARPEQVTVVAAREALRRYCGKEVQ